MAIFLHLVATVLTLGGALGHHCVHSKIASRFKPIHAESVGASRLLKEMASEREIVGLEKEGNRHNGDEVGNQGNARAEGALGGRESQGKGGEKEEREKNDMEAKGSKEEKEKGEEKNVKDADQDDTDEWRSIKILTEVYEPGVGLVDGVIFDLIKTSVSGRLKRYFSKLIRVRGSRFIKAFSDTGCGEELTVPPRYRTGETEADLLLFVRVILKEEEFLAWGSACLLSPEDSRPLVGLITLNAEKVGRGVSAANELFWALAHELIHVLGFSPSLFQHFPVGLDAVVSMETGSEGTKVGRVVLPEVADVARMHFDCPNVTGVLLEDEGSFGEIGSHWEHRLLGNELLTSQATGLPILSAFTLAFLNGIGWYRVKLPRAQRLLWGRGRGCRFFEACEPSFPEFCPEVGRLVCTADFLAKSHCSPDAFTNGCAVRDHHAELLCGERGSELLPAFPPGFEALGPFSRCFEVRKNGETVPACFLARCRGSRVQISVLNRIFTCEKAGETLKLLGVEVVCPSAEAFCSSLRLACLNDCDSRGRCTDEGTCECEYPASGEFCQLDQPCSFGETLACPMLKPPPHDSNGRSFVNLSSSEPFAGFSEDSLNDTWPANVFVVTKQPNGTLATSVPEWELCTANFSTSRTNLPPVLVLTILVLLGL